MKEDGTINVLSLDGGGIKGLYTARVLQHFEETYSIKVSDCFDLICGTSTGGLITLGLASGHSAKSIGDFYENRGKHIFPYMNSVVRELHYYKSLIITSKYPGSQLRREVESFLGKDLKMKDLDIDVCIPTYDVSRGKPVMFKKSSNPDYTYDLDLSLVDVALATSAAPSYFPMHSIVGTQNRNGYYIDGGIWANDPSICGLLEVIREKPVENRKQIKILSISAIPVSAAITKPSSHRYSFRNWGAKLFDYSAQAQSELNSNIMKWLSSIQNIEYHRIEPEKLSAAQLKYIKMDSALTKSIGVYNHLGKQSGIDFVRLNSMAASNYFNH